LSSKANYANLERILQELDYSEEIMKRIGCPVINVSNKAIEETVVSSSSYAGAGLCIGNLGADFGAGFPSTGFPRTLNILPKVSS
ncbi:kinase/pyrophosphorylase, partial [Clostridioides difficile]